MATPFRVLAVDGGGIRGIIPALLLQAIETQTQRRICELFDLVAGTSTGGILALGLTKPGADGKVEMSAQDIIQLYEKEGSTIFPTSIVQNLHLSAVPAAQSLRRPRGSTPRSRNTSATPLG